MRKRRWRPYLRHIRRRIRDQCYVTLSEVWECISIHWLTFGAVLLIILTLFFIEYRLRQMPPRQDVQEQQMKDLELIPTDPCSGKKR
jgi:hypothetical protein